jgi:hypothetical protein
MKRRVQSGGVLHGVGVLDVVIYPVMVVAVMDKFAL